MRSFSVLAGLAIFTSELASAETPKKPASGWEQVLHAGEKFGPRDEAKGLVLGEGMWLRGGTPGGSDLLYDTWFSADGANWSRRDENDRDGNEKVHSYSLLVSVDRKTMLGIEDGKVFQFDAPRWTAVAGGQGFRRPEAAVVADKTIFCLDRDPPRAQDGVQKGRLWSSADGGKTWTIVNDNVPFGPRRPNAMAAFKGKLWVIGGVGDADRPALPTEYYPWKMYNDVWSSGDGGKTWRKSAVKQEWVPRNWAGSASDAERMWIVGGFDNILKKDRIADLNDVWSSQDGEHWVSQGPGGFTPRHAPTCYIHDGYLWVVAGKENTTPSSGRHTNDVWRLRLPGRK